MTVLDVFEELDALDAVLDALPHGALSLARGRDRATPLGRAVRAVSDAPDHARAVAAALAEVVRAELRHFPENLFWDHDFLVAELAALDAPAREANVACIVRLMTVYGVQGPIRFQFVHDFAYGLDWATYVRRTGATGLRPFDGRFLAHAERRGRELEAIVRGGADPRWPAVEPDARRNVFDFERGPDVELRILRDLAARGELPLEAYEPAGRFDASRDYQALRRAAAWRVGARPNETAGP